jgi:hypothetical protein
MNHPTLTGIAETLAYLLEINRPAQTITPAVPAEESTAECPTETAE